MDSNLPGPGAYDQGNFLGKSGNKFTMIGRGRTTNKDNSPGPGSYEPKT